MPNTGSSYEAAIPLAGWARAVQRSALQEMLSLASGPGILSLALGLPAAEFFPVEAYAEAVAHVLSADPRALQYGPPSERLKAQVVELMATRGVECQAAQVFITSGAQQGLSLLTRLLLEPGGTVLTEEMIYPGFREVIEPFQPRLLTVPTDLGTGMDVKAVERLLRGGERPALIYTVADGHNPLAVSMSAEKSARLAELARRYGIPVIEDDPYGFIYYGERPTTPVKAADEQWVYYAGSFSKILAPALRVGWLVVPEELTARLSIVKESSDIDTATLSQRAVSHFLDSCDLDGRLAGLRREYAACAATPCSAPSPSTSRTARAGRSRRAASSSGSNCPRASRLANCSGRRQHGAHRLHPRPSLLGGPPAAAHQLHAPQLLAQPARSHRRGRGPAGQSAQVALTRRR